MGKETERIILATQQARITGVSDVRRIPSPASTGGAGFFFEQRVVAYWLAQLLGRQIPPILRDCLIAEVHLQTEHLGWRTDDFLIVGQKTGSGESRRLAGQVKQTFTVSAADAECKKAIQDFWRDFQNSNLFSPDTDRFALVTQPGRDTLHAFSSLLNSARDSRDASDFENRLATVVSKKVAQHLEKIQKNR